MLDSTSNCETISERISASLDDGSMLTQEVLDHLSQCADCSEFLDLWSGPIPQSLAGDLPGASGALRERILQLPALTHPDKVIRPKWKIKNLFSIAAAISLLGICTFLLVDVNPGFTGSQQTAKQELKVESAEAELAAIRSDFKRGLIAVNRPITSINRTLQP